MAGSRRESTLTVYNSRLAAFSECCEEKGCSPRGAPCPVLADFLIHLLTRAVLFRPYEAIVLPLRQFTMVFMTALTFLTLPS